MGLWGASGCEPQTPCPADEVGAGQAAGPSCPRVGASVDKHLRYSQRGWLGGERGQAAVTRPTSALLPEREAPFAVSTPH